jgi:hypothetical protein
MSTILDREAELREQANDYPPCDRCGVEMHDRHERDWEHSTCAECLEAEARS